MDGWLGFILAGFALAGSPGAATLSLAATGAAFGVRPGLGYMGGIVVGMMAVMVITASGVVGLLLALPGATPVLTAIAGAYFLYLAFKIATAPPLAAESRQRRQPAFATGLILSLVNPKGYAAMAALFSGFMLVRERPATDLAAKIVLLTMIIAAVNLAWLMLGATLTGFLREPRKNRAINIAMAILLILSLAVVLRF
jgi:threonine/homoserine/homoserine lactone efflux protein